MLECMILNRYENMSTSDKWWIDVEFRNTLQYLSMAIYNSVNDPKGIQGDLNSFSYSEKSKISEGLSNAHSKAAEAFNLEVNVKDQKAAVKKWKERKGRTDLRPGPFDVNCIASANTCKKEKNKCV